MGLRYPTALMFSLMVLVAGGCGKNEFQAPPPPTVTVATPAMLDVVEYARLTGSTEVGTAVDVRARVSGILEKIRFEPGTEVRAGDPLFQIDAVPFAAARDALQARVESAEAALRLAENKAERVERSALDGAVTELQALEARAEADVAAAALKVAQRELAIKQLDVDYTDIRAPISGWIERSPFDVGDLVGNSAATSLLTTVYDDSQIRVYFSVTDRIYLQAIRNGASNAQPPVVEIGTELDEGYPFVGHIDYADPTVDEATGTIRVRAVVRNDDRRLVGGLFVRLRLAVRTLENALLVPQIAIGADQVGSYVLVVGEDGVVERRNIEIGPLDGPDRVVISGLAPTDRVIVRGLLRARPGSAVTAKPVGP